MKVLVIGNGGREHAIIQKCLESHYNPIVYCAPGIDAIAGLITNITISVTDIENLCNFAKTESIDLTIVGPEAPLVNGIVDLFQKHNLRIFGPTQAAAELENSKAFSKMIMKKYNIPTADYEVFTNFEEAANYIKHNTSYPIVIKASGLAGGKGVVIPESESEALRDLNDIMNDKVFGDSGNKVVIESFLTGEEASIFAFCDGDKFKLISPSQDHKRIGEGDTGKNTGGMGAYAPAPVANDAVLKRASEDIIQPLLNGMKSEGSPYTGILFCGLMIDNDKPSVVEFNVRLGDPETQVVLPLIKSDFIDFINSCLDHNLEDYKLELDEDNHCMTVVLASGGYPETYAKGYEITGVSNLNQVSVYYAGTKVEDGILKTNGGRVLNVTAKAKSLKDCASKIYSEIDQISFKDMVYRKDIGHRVLK